MQIEQGNDTEKNGKKKAKTATIIAILIVITLIIVIAIIFLILSRRGPKLSTTIDGKTASLPEDTFLFSEDGKVYVSIRDIAPFVGYEAHNGEYKVNIEDTNKMYVEAVNGTETTSFYLNSTMISKVAPDKTTNNQKETKDYENITIKEPVTMINNKMYIASEGFSAGFNSLFGYNKEKNQIIIQTLPYLLEQYTAKITEYGYAKISEDFDNQKALIYGMIVASKENTEKFGVIDIQGNEIISPRYNKIQFVESAGEFIITNSSGKVGIAYSTGKTKITVAYDEIKVMDSNLGLYLVKSNNKYGVIDSKEKSIIYIEYDQIGVDTSKFPNDNIKNQYILCDTIIPAKINNKWRLFKTDGNRLTDAEYDSVGYIGDDRSDRVEGNALVIGDTKTIVVGNEKKYGGVDVKGNILIPLRFEQIYSLTSAGNTSYYILHQGNEYSATDYIGVMKKQLKYDEEIENEIMQNTTSASTNEITSDMTSAGVVTSNTIVNNVNNQSMTNETSQNEVIYEMTNSANAVPTPVDVNNINSSNTNSIESYTPQA